MDENLFNRCPLDGEWGKPFRGIPLRGDAYRDRAGEWVICETVSEHPRGTTVCKPKKPVRRRKQK